MAKLILNPAFAAVQGDLGGFVVRKIRGKDFLSRRPVHDPNRKPTANEKAAQDRLRAASNYAKMVQITPALYDFYAPPAKARGVRVRALAISDWFEAPTVETIDLRRYRGRRGDPIDVQARDRFGVIQVQVRVVDAAGQVIESGPAMARGKRWRYTATATLPRDTAVTIQATAQDRPRREGMREATWPPAPADPRSNPSTPPATQPRSRRKPESKPR